MGIAAYKAIVSFAGTSTAFTNEACTAVGTNRYQINTAIRRLLDRNVPVVVRANGVTVPATDYTINYFTGVIQFTGAKTAPITIASANYIPVATAGGVKGYSLTIQGDILDDTDLAFAQANNGYKRRIYGLLDVAVSISRHSDFGAQFVNNKRNRDIVLINIQPGGATSGWGFAGWFVAESVADSGELAGLEEETISFNLDGFDKQSFSFTGTISGIPMTP